MTDVSGWSSGGRGDLGADLTGSEGADMTKLVRPRPPPRTLFTRLTNPLFQFQFCFPKLRLPTLNDFIADKIF